MRKIAAKLWLKTQSAAKPTDVGDIPGKHENENNSGLFVHNVNQFKHTVVIFGKQRHGFIAKLL